MTRDTTPPARCPKQRGTDDRGSRSLPSGPNGHIETRADGAHKVTDRVQNLAGHSPRHADYSRSVGTEMALLVVGESRRETPLTSANSGLSGRWVMDVS